MKDTDPLPVAKLSSTLVVSSNNAPDEAVRCLDLAGVAFRLGWRAVEAVPWAVVWVVVWAISSWDAARRL
jgi:hypothetical protein